MLLASSAAGPVVRAPDGALLLSIFHVLSCLVLGSTGVLAKYLDVIELCRPWVGFPQDHFGNRLVFGPKCVFCELQGPFRDCC